MNLGSSRSSYGRSPTVFASSFLFSLSSDASLRIYIVQEDMTQ